MARSPSGQPRMVDEMGATTLRRRPTSSKTGAPSRCVATPESTNVSLAPGTGFGVFVNGDLTGEINLNSVQRGPFQNAYVGYWIDEPRPVTATPRSCRGGDAVRIRGARSPPRPDRHRPSQRTHRSVSSKRSGSEPKALPSATSRSTERRKTSIRFAITSKSGKRSARKMVDDWL